MSSLDEDKPISATTGSRVLNAARNGAIGRLKVRSSLSSDELENAK
jgi:hypothetical protein